MTETAHTIDDLAGTADELRRCDGLVIPGGESTTMALVAERWGLVGPLKEYASSGKPLWGTCAGLIFLANRAVGELVFRGPSGERGGGRGTTESRVLKFYYCDIIYYSNQFLGSDIFLILVSIINQINLINS